MQFQILKQYDLLTLNEGQICCAVSHNCQTNKQKSDLKKKLEFEIKCDQAKELGIYCQLDC